MLRRKEGKEGECADQIGERKRGSALPEGFAPGEGNPQEKVGRGLRPRKGETETICLKGGKPSPSADSFCSLGISLRRRLLALQEKFLNCFLLSRLVCRFAHFVLPSCEKKDLLLARRAVAQVPGLRLQLLLCLS